MSGDEINKKLEYTEQQPEYSRQQAFALFNENKNLKMYAEMTQQELQDRGNRIEELEKVLRTINEW